MGRHWVDITAVGFFMGPHGFSAIYSARSEATLRRNAMLLPFYQIVMLLVFSYGIRGQLRHEIASLRSQ